MPSVNFILGKRERNVVKPLIPKNQKPLSHSEITPYHKTENVHYYANAKQFSFRTERDETQSVGKLYKGYIDD